LPAGAPELGPLWQDAAVQRDAGRSLTADLAPAIETHELTKRYGNVQALNGLTMRVERGEVFGFLGPNGAGKTTALKLLLGLSTPTSGTAAILGNPIGDRRSRRRLGYLPELFRYQSWMRAREVLALHCQLADLPRNTWTTEVGDALEVVGLDTRANDQVGTFSKGMQQRLGLGAALLGRPELVLLDEPTSALDPVGRQDVRRIVRDLRDRGVAVFLNSHLLAEIERVCDRVAIVDRGRIVTSGTIDELLAVRAVRIRVTGLGPTELARLAPFGHIEVDGDWLTAAGVPPDEVPDLVAAIVGAGGRIHAVDQQRQSLEDRFVELVARDAAQRDAAARELASREAEERDEAARKAATRSGDGPGNGEARP
jgi:ABC-2 type transport system ATP-binding protein